VAYFGRDKPFNNVAAGENWIVWIFKIIYTTGIMPYRGRKFGYSYGINLRIIFKLFNATFA